MQFVYIAAALGVAGWALWNARQMGALAGTASQPQDADPGAADPSLTGGEDLPVDASDGLCNNPGRSALAHAIATAEGYFSGNTRPMRNNNPGDFRGAGDAGAEGGYAKYSSAAAGWARLCRQIQMISEGSSHVYTLDMSIAEMATHWTEDVPIGSQAGWAVNVAADLGVGTDTTLRAILGG